MLDAHWDGSVAETLSNGLHRTAAGRVEEEPRKDGLAGICYRPFAII